MADEYRPEDYDRGEPQERYRSQRQGRFDYSGEPYPGGYEGARPGRYDDQRYRERQSAPAGRYGQGQSFGRYGQQGWEREQQPGQYSRPNDWSRGLQQGEWQRQQQWELEGGPSADWLPEESRRRQYSGERWQGSRGGPYGMEYPESPYSSPGGYGEMSRGEMGRGDIYGREGTYGRYAGRGPKGYTRSDDRIRDDVCERLTQAWDVDAEDIDVKVKDGEVTLSGSVMDRYQKRMAEDAVDGVPGVRDINNQLRAGMGGERQGQMATPTGQYRQGSMGSTSSGTRGTSGRSGTSSRSTSGRSTPTRSTGTSGRSASTSRSSASPRTSSNSRTTSLRSSTSGGSSGASRSSATRPSTAGRSSTSSGRAGTASAKSGTTTSRPSTATSQSRSTTPSPTESKPASQDPFQPESRPNF